MGNSTELNNVILINEIVIINSPGEVSRLTNVGSDTWRGKTPC